MTSTELPAEIKAERSPEEAALMMRLRVFGNMRWAAIIGIVVATLIASRVFHIGFPAVPVYITCLFIALYNLVLVWQLRSLEKQAAGSIVPKARTYGNLHIFLDLMALIVILHFTGGIENPFLFYFVFHIILASIVLQYRNVYLLATVAILMLILLVGLEYGAVLPHVNLAGFAPPTLYRQGSYILAVSASLATLLYGSAYMATAISTLLFFHA